MLSRKSIHSVNLKIFSVFVFHRSLSVPSSSLSPRSSYTRSLFFFLVLSTLPLCLFSLLKTETICWNSIVATSFISLLVSVHRDMVYARKRLSDMKLVKKTFSWPVFLILLYKSSSLNAFLCRSFFMFIRKKVYHLVKSLFYIM